MAMLEVNEMLGWLRYYRQEFESSSVVTGSAGDDVLRAGPNRHFDAYLLVAGAGDDRVTGAKNVPNFINGGSGNDRLKGGEAKDLFLGGRGIDKLIGGGGDDVFAFINPRDVSARSGAADVIADFGDTRGDQDLINLWEIDAMESRAGNNAFRLVDRLTGREGQLDVIYERSGNRTILEGDTDGDAVADISLILLGKIKIDGGDLIL